MQTMQIQRIQLFQLTTSRRGRQFAEESRPETTHFNSLPHAEVDFIVHITFPPVSYFNSLPHAEVDCDCLVATDP